MMEAKNYKFIQVITIGEKYGGKYYCITNQSTSATIGTIQFDVDEKLELYCFTPVEQVPLTVGFLVEITDFLSSLNK